MIIPHLFSAADGASHIGEIELPMTGGATRIQSVMQGAVSWRIAVNQPGHSVPFHPTPAPTLLIVMSGEHETSASDGSVLVSRAGDMLFAEDLTGQGHAVRFTGITSSTTLIIVMPTLGILR